MQTVIVTGMSGAGKSTAVHILEDIGYYCIDNLPPTLLSNFITLCHNSNVTMEKLAIVVDARSGELISHLSDEIEMFKKRGNECAVVFLDADDKTLIKRYKETRRKHPHAGNGRIEDGIRVERALLSKLKKSADLVLDTSSLLTKDFKAQFLKLFETAKKIYEPITVNLVSFGFKRGIPIDCDLMFDVRFMPNPFYDEELKTLTGKDERVKQYALDNERSRAFLEKLADLVLFLLPQYAIEGKHSLVVGIGCTGGKHRSVAVAEVLGEALKEKNYLTTVNHRDLGAE